MILVIFPQYKYYKKITIDADLLAIRQPSQLGDDDFDKSKVILFDKFIPKDIAEKFNKQAVAESLNHAKINGQDVTTYKGVSLADINFVEILLKIFIPAYREALSFLSCVGELRPSVVYLEKEDERLDLFEEIAKQMGVQLKIYDNFGLTDNDLTNLIKISYSRVRDVNFHPALKLKIIWRWLVFIYNMWADIIRFFRGKKPFVFFTFYKPLNLIKSKLLFSKEYYPVVQRPVKMSIKCLLFSGTKILPFEDSKIEDKAIKKIIEGYFKILQENANKAFFGQIDYFKNKISISATISKLLKIIVAPAFYQIAKNIDVLGKFISNNHIGDCLLNGDSSWENRLIVRMCQKHSIPNNVVINGIIADDHQIEAKTADTTLYYGESMRNNYLKDKANCIPISSPLYQNAYKKRLKINTKFPPQNILIGSFTFSPVDINCHYSDSERFLIEILEVLKKFAAESKFKFKVSAKLHPADVKDFYQWFLKDKNFEDVEIIAGGDFQKIVSKFDLLIINYSTAIFETALMGIPVIFYHPNNQMLFEPFDGLGPLPTARSTDELGNMLKKMFENQDYALSFTNIKKLQPFTGPIDGRAGERILNIINSNL